MDIRYTIAIAGFNEEGNVRRFPEELFPSLDAMKTPYEVLLIDDGSIDGTRAAMQAVADTSPKTTRVIVHEKNKGLGASIKTAVREAHGTFLILLDADLTFHPKEIPKLAAAQTQTDADCVIGSHLMQGGAAAGVQPFRLFLNRAVNVLYMIVSGARITSFSAMFRLYRVSALRTLDLQSNDFALSAEMLAKLIRARKKIVEVPVALGRRTIGQSKIRFLREIKNHLKLLAKILYWRFFSR